MKTEEKIIFKKLKWYQHPVFPLIPQFEFRKSEDIHNTNNFSFRWLFIKIWTLDSFDFEFSFVITNHWGIGIIGILPYLRWVITIPFPEKFSIWIQKNLWRKPKY